LRHYKTCASHTASIQADGIHGFFSGSKSMFAWWCVVVAKLDPAGIESILRELAALALLLVLLAFAHAHKIHLFERIATVGDVLDVDRALERPRRWM